MVSKTNSLNTWFSNPFKFQLRGEGKGHPCDINSYDFLDQGSRQHGNQSPSLPQGYTALPLTHGSHARNWARTHLSSGSLPIPLSCYVIMYPSLKTQLEPSLCLDKVKVPHLFWTETGLPGHAAPHHTVAPLPTEPFRQGHGEKAWTWGQWDLGWVRAL